MHANAQRPWQQRVDTALRLVLQDAVLAPASSPEMRRAALDEAAVLVRLRSPEAGLVASALEAGHREEAARATDLARTYLPVAEAALSRQAGCGDCDAAAVEAQLGAESGLTNAEETRRAVTMLRAIGSARAAS